MANDLSANPIKVDTTFSVGSGKGRTLKVTKIEWFNPAGTTDTFSITEHISGKTLLQGKCETAGQSQIFDFTRKPLILPASSDWDVAITSGTLYIWFE